MIAVLSGILGVIWTVGAGFFSLLLAFFWSAQRRRGGGNFKVGGHFGAF
jgi:hypothetical protein